MRAKTEELLYFLLWTAETFSFPTFRNLTDTFESWAYRRGFLRQLQRLEQQKWLEGQESPAGDRLYRLTDAGRIRALDGRDPEARWRRHWDGRWRLVIFDVPEKRRSARAKLRRYLKKRGFGYLQNSVWITPDPLEEECELLAEGPVNAELLAMFAGRPCSGEKDSDIVSGAWNFTRINQGYDAHQKTLTARPRNAIQTEAGAKAFQHWLREEREAWRKAVEEDPLLPEKLLPDDYAGREAWTKRQKAMAEAAAQIRAFDPG